MEVSGNLRDLYNDKDELRKVILGFNEFVEFYNRFKDIKKFYWKYLNEICVLMLMEFEELLKVRENLSEEV